MPKLSLLCPLPLEYEAVRKLLTHPTYHTNGPLDMAYEVGNILIGSTEWSVKLFLTGPNIDNMQSKTTAILSAFPSDYIFLIGIAGGIKDVAIGDVVVADKSYGYETGKISEEEMMITPEVEHTPELMIQLAQELARQHLRSSVKGDDYKVLVGPIASGNKVIASRSSGVYKMIVKNYRDTKAVEMEAIGFARAARKAKVAFLNIRGISDLLDHKALSDTDGSRELAAARAARFCWQLLHQLDVSSIKSHKVVYSAKAHRSFAWRRFQYGQLEFGSEQVQFHGKDIQFYIKQILDVQHIAMPGDLAKNWVEVSYIDDGKKRNAYFSNAALLGWGSLFGSSKHLHQQLEGIQAYQKLISSDI